MLGMSRKDLAGELGSCVAKPWLVYRIQRAGGWVLQVCLVHPCAVARVAFANLLPNACNARSH